MNNIPQVKLGIISVSRDCFVISLSENRKKAVVAAYAAKGGTIFDVPTVVENENDMLKAVAEANAAECNALVVLLGNFGPETPETLVAKYFNGPVLYVASAEESANDLINGRGDAYCGMLNCSYNLGLRKLKAIIPEYPVGTADDICAMIADFLPVARAILGLSSLKVITFGPRPHDFFACNAPIKALYDIGVEIQENSELDLLVAYNKHKDDPRIPALIEEIAAELGEGNKMAGILPRLAQYELTLMDWIEANKGSCKHVVMANKCWPAFQTEFGFVPCYINSRMTAKGIPISCEVDIYGALSEYIGTCITEEAVTLLDINNSVPADMFETKIKGNFDYKHTDTFMGFHCGNTPVCRLKKGEMKYQLIMKRALEPDTEPDITRGTLEGDIIPGAITFFRLHSNPDTSMQAYIAQGEVLPVDSCSFGGIGVFAIPEMGRFYRNVLIGKRYPHHGAVAFGHHGKALFTVFDYLGVPDIEYNRPAGVLYARENPFA